MFYDYCSAGFLIVKQSLQFEAYLDCWLFIRYFSKNLNFLTDGHVFHFCLFASCLFFRLFVLISSSVLFSFLYRRTSHKLLCSQLHFREALTTNGYHYHKCVAFVFNLTHLIIKSLHFLKYNFLLIKFIKWNKIKFGTLQSHDFSFEPITVALMFSSKYRLNN